MLAIISLVLVSAAPVPKDEPADWKPILKDRAFKFDDAAKAAAAANDEAKKAGYVAEYTASPDGFGEGEFTFAKKDGKKISVAGHASSAFAFRGDVLYFANFSPIATGCQIVAYDLATGKKAWDKALTGIGPIDHTKYRNRVVMSVEKHPTVKDAFALVITGWEAFGAYVEVIDLDIGKQLAHKKFKPNELPK